MHQPAHLNPKTPKDRAKRNRRILGIVSGALLIFGTIAVVNGIKYHNKEKRGEGEHKYNAKIEAITPHYAVEFKKRDSINGQADGLIITYEWYDNLDKLTGKCDTVRLGYSSQDGDFSHTISIQDQNGDDKRVVIEEHSLHKTAYQQNKFILFSLQASKYHGDILNKMLENQPGTKSSGYSLTKDVNVFNR